MGSKQLKKILLKIKIRIVILIVVITFLTIFLYSQNNWIGLTELEIVSKHLPGNFEGLRIVQLSDLHSKSFGRGQKKLEKIITMAEPDIIVMTGDMIDSSRYDENTVMALVEKAVKIAPVFYVTGNHEMWTGKFPGLEVKLKEAGAVVLRNTSKKITVGAQFIYIAGIDDPETEIRPYDGLARIESMLHEAIPLLPPDSFKVLLSHRPEAFNLYSSYGVDVVFCGHAHGGQFRLPFLGGLYAPGQGFFPRYTSGVHRDGNTSMVVNRGLGNSSISQRLFNRPEVVVAILR